MCMVAVFGVGEDFFQRNAKEPCVDLVNFCHGALRYGDKPMDGNARCSGAALGPDFVTGAGGRMFYTVRDHAVVQLGNLLLPVVTQRNGRKAWTRQASVATNIVAVKDIAEQRCSK